MCKLLELFLVYWNDELTSARNSFVNKVGSDMEIFRYIGRWKIHELEAFVPYSGAVAVVQVVCVHLGIAFPLSGVQHIVDSHSSQKRFVFGRHPV